MLSPSTLLPLFPLSLPPEWRTQRTVLTTPLPSPPPPPLAPPPTSLPPSRRLSPLRHTHFLEPKTVEISEQPRTAEAKGRTRPYPSRACASFTCHLDERVRNCFVSLDILSPSRSLARELLNISGTRESSEGGGNRGDAAGRQGFGEGVSARTEGRYESREHFTSGRPGIDNSSPPQRADHREQRGGFRGECAAQGAGGIHPRCCSVELNILFALFFSGPFQQRGPVYQVVTHPSGSRPLFFFLYLLKTHRSSVPRNQSGQLMMCLSEINRADAQGYFAAMFVFF